MASRVALTSGAVVVFLLASALRADEPQLPDVLVTRQLAARAELHVGDVVTFASDANGTRAARFRIAGIYEPTPDPMRFTAARMEARMHLPDVIALTADPRDPAAAEAVDAINIRFVDPADRAAFQSDLRARAPGLAATPTARAPEHDPFAVLDRFHVAISVVTVLGGTAFLLALMIIRAEERREMIGLLRRSLLAAVLLEGFFIAVIGAIVGIAIALAGERMVNMIFQRRYDTALVFVRVTPSVALRSVAVAVPLGIAAGAAASWSVLRRGILSLIHR